MAGQIRGIEIAINADTTGVTRGLRDITTQSMQVTRNLNTVNSLLRLNPGQTELVAERQRLLAGAVGTTREKLNQLRSAQEDVNTAFQRGDISEEEYIAFQGEIARTEARLSDLESQTDETGEAMDDSAEKSTKFGDALKNGLKVGAEVALTAIAAVSAAVIGLGKQVIEGTAELEQNLGGSESVFGEHAKTMQSAAEQAYKNMGLSQSEYLSTANKMGALFQGVGLTVEESANLTQTAMQRAADMASVMGVDLSSAMESVAGAAKGNFTMMDNLGVAINDTTLKAYAQEKGLGDLATTQDKVNAAMQLFLEKTDQYDGNFAKEAEETISGSIGLVKAAYANLVTALGSDTADIESMTNILMNALLSVLNNVKPIIENMVKALPKVVQTAIKALQNILPTIIPSIIDMIVQSLPALMELGATIVTALADAIIDQLPQILNVAIELILMLSNGLAEALPTLVPTITEIMLLITNTLLDNIDLLVDASIAIMLALSEGMVNALPLLISNAPVIVQKLVDAIIANVPKILGAAVLLIEQLVRGIIDNFPAIMDAGIQILETLWNALKSGYNTAVQTGNQIVTWVGDGVKSVISSAMSWGKDLIQGMIDGIKSKIADVKNAVGDIAETIKSYLHFSVPDVGPLTTYESWMPDFMQGLAQGIRSNKHLVTEAMQDLTSDMSINANASINGSGGGSIGSQVINVNWYGNVSSSMDLQDSARQIGQMLQYEMSANASMKGLYA